jgi:hypothetical protein
MAMSSERIGSVFIALVAVGLLASGCGGSKAAGTEGGPCYGNFSCNPGLTCLPNNLCANPNATGGTSGTGGAGGTGGDACAGLPVKAQSCVSSSFSEKINNKIDILFMVDDSSSMIEMQQKLYDQLPNFVTVLQRAQIPPDLHIAVVSSDMGAPGDSTAGIGCTASGDQGGFRSMPQGTCTDTTLQNGSTFISDDGAGDKNYTGPALSQVLQCITLLGDKGCGFEHQLASIARALGADGSPLPSTNANFLRPDAYLGIVILTNEDDCSAPASTQLYSLNGGQQNIANPLGPLANYRCNQYGHLCVDPGGNQIMPPLNPPNGATTLDLTNCESNDSSTGLLTPVSQFVSEIKALKPDPDNQILVAAIAGPPTPYSVSWVPEVGGQNTQPGELWPEVEHSCGAVGGDDVNPENPLSQETIDGTFSDPGVRITQFVSSFQDSVVASICDFSYAASLHAIATKLGQLITPPCITQTIQQDGNGNPDCTVVENVTNNSVTQKTAIPYCATNSNTAPCWNLAGGTGTCTGETLLLNDTPQNATAQSVSVTLSCSVCMSGAKLIGCPCPSSGSIINSAIDLANCK